MLSPQEEVNREEFMEELHREACRADAYTGVRALIELVGDDPDRDDMRNTAIRYVRALEEMLSGYKEDPADLMKTFDAADYDQMIILRNIEFVSVCEHHLLPFTGTASVGYIPLEGRIIGLSKLARVFDIYAKRLQVQERLTSQVADALQTHLMPLGVACVVRANHMCMTCRGVKKPNAEMVTSSMTGAFRLVPEARAEFLALG